MGLGLIMEEDMIALKCAIMLLLFILEQHDHSNYLNIVIIITYNIETESVQRIKQMSQLET